MPVYLAPWKRDADEPLWRSPYATTQGVIDMRSILQIRGDGIAEGFGLFRTRDTETVKDAILLGDSPLSTVDRNVVKIALGLGEDIIAPDIAGMIFELRTQHADHLGMTRWGTSVPQLDGYYNVWLGDRIARIPIVTTGTRWTNLVKRLQESYRSADAAGKGPQFLSVLMRKYKVRDHEQFIPSNMPSVEPETPKTPIVDDFARADQNLEASSDWSALKGSFAIVSEVCQADTISDETSFQHQTALSTDDHYAQIDVVTLNAPSSTRTLAAAVARHAAGVNGYFYDASRSTSATFGRLFKRNTDFTTLEDNAETFSLPDTIRIEVDGDQISGKINESLSAGPVTDGTVPSSFNVGMSSRTQNASAGDIAMDNFEADNLPVGGLPQRHYPRGVLTGVGRGTAA